MQDTGFATKDSSLVYFKVLSMGLLPIIMMAVYIIIFSIVKVIKNHDGLTFIRNVIVSVITTIYLVHPTLAR